MTLTSRVERALRVEGLSKHFGGVAALTDVSFELAPGEVFGVVGPNGAGKTTLVNVITGWLDRPDGGRVLYGGQDLTGRSAEMIASAGITRTFQHIRLFGHLSAIDNVVVGLDTLRRRQRREHGVKRRRAARKRAVELLDRVGLTEGLEQDASTLPYGAQRRVEIARALAANPGLLLLDEPVAGMNEQEATSISTLVRTLVTEDELGVLLVEHNMAFVRRTCDRMCVLNFGAILADGTPESCLADPAVREAYLGTKTVRSSHVEIAHGG